MATKKISELPQVTPPLNGESPVLVVQDGVTKQALAADISKGAIRDGNITLGANTQRNITLTGGESGGTTFSIYDLQNDADIATFESDGTASNFYFNSANTGQSVSFITGSQEDLTMGITTEADPVFITFPITNGVITFTAPYGVQGQTVKVVPTTEDTTVGTAQHRSTNYFTNDGAGTTITFTLGTGHSVGTQFTFTRTSVESMYVVSDGETFNVAYNGSFQSELDNVYFSDDGDTLTVTKVSADTWHGVASGSGIIFND